MSSAIFASHDHKNKKIEVKQLLYHMSGHVGKCLACMLVRLLDGIQWNPRLGGDSTGCVCVLEVRLSNRRVSGHDAAAPDEWGHNTWELPRR